VDVATAAPEAYQAMTAFTAAADAGLDRTVAELVKLRASQLNGCAFCVALHTGSAGAAGVTADRLAALPTWRDSALFTEREHAALALAEAVTFVAEDRVPDEVYAAAAARFTDVELAHLLWTLAAINAWNRVSVATRLTPPFTPPS
jgi:AhpD family alkylhydroperoxidase